MASRRAMLVAAMRPARTHCRQLPHPRRLGHGCVQFEELPMSTGLSARRGAQGALALYLALLSGASWPADDSQVVVTASRIEEPVADSFWSSTVLTREDIESRQVSSLQDLLADLAGVNIDNTGGLGKASSLFLRGASADHTLLLIDGTRVGSATLGVEPFELIPLEQIDRIEIVRGPRSTLYGSDAVGGVVQIFTRHPSQPGFAAGGSVMDGSHDTHEFTADLQARGERAWASISGDTLTTRGISTCLPGALAANAGCFLDAPNPNPDGFHNHSGSLSAGVRLSERLTARLDSLIADGWTAFDGDFTNNTQFTERVTSLHLDGSVTDAWHARLTAGRNVDVQKNFLDRDPSSRFDTTRDSASLQIDGQATPALRVISGADYENDRIDSDTPYDLTSRHTRGVFTELRGELAAWSALAGARLEDNSQFGNHVTENFGITRKLGERQRLTATWGTAFRAPTFNELYYPGFGNRSLLPETSRSAELGADGSTGALRWSLHAYQTTIDRLIAFAFDATTTSFLPQNVARARIRGAELQADWHNRAWKIGGQLTRMEPLNLSDDSNSEHLLPRSAKTSAALQVR
ncbi:MAG: TonB-dependent receptor, partial [Gammaproteobacteria bacterium]